MLDGGCASAIPMENRGMVLESQSAAGYSFLRVQREDGQIWIASLTTAAEAGQTVAWTQGIVMQNFDSPTLGRTFESILFVDGLQIVG